MLSFVPKMSVSWYDLRVTAAERLLLGLWNKLVEFDLFACPFVYDLVLVFK